jgi:hypothetical protein
MIIYSKPVNLSTIRETDLEELSFMIDVRVPRINAMLICDYVITEQGTNKKSLIGIFENINALKFPCMHHALTVYIKFTDAMGEYRVRLELVDLKNDKIIAKAESPRQMKVSDPLVAHELVFSLRGLRFQHAGEHEFRVFANDKIFGQKTFRVVDRRKPQDK